MQGSILCPLLFTLLWMISPSLEIVVWIFMQMTLLSISLAKTLQKYRKFLKQSLELWLTGLNKTSWRQMWSKTQLMVLIRRRRKRKAEQTCIYHNGSMLISEEKVRYLGMDINRNLTWKDQVHKVRRSCVSSLARISIGSDRFYHFKPRKSCTMHWYFPYGLLLCCLDGMWGKPEQQNWTIAKRWDAADHIFTMFCL